MKKLYFSLIVAIFFIGCSDSDKERTVEILPLGDVPDDTYSGGYNNDGSFDVPHNPHTGSIAGYPWNTLSLGFEEPENYPYGFDRSPLSDVSPEKDRYVYISTTTTEKAYFKAIVSDETYDSYRLINNISGDVIKVIDKEIVDVFEGEYTLQGENAGSWIDLDKHVKVISYEPKEKEIIYIQLDGDGWDTENDQYAFTKERVETGFNEVYSQVVMTPNVIERAATFYNNERIKLDFNEMLQINMVYRSDLIAQSVYDQATKILLDQVENISLKDIDANKLKERHIVFAVNKTLKYWPLEGAYILNQDYLDFYSNPFHFFYPELEPVGTTYAIQSVGKCEDGVGPEPIPVTIRKVSELIDGQTRIVYKPYHNGKPVTFGPCDYLYTKNGLPELPINIPGALAVSFSLQKEVKREDDSETIDFFGLGSVVWVPRGIGPSSIYTMMHELGHSFGLTDVAETGRWLNPNDGYLSSTTETPLMSWRSPSGRKLRYRGVQVVYTGGATIDGSPGERIECPVNGVLDNQWACLRDECDYYNRYLPSNPIFKYYGGMIAPHNCKE